MTVDVKQPMQVEPTRGWDAISNDELRCLIAIANNLALMVTRLDALLVIMAKGRAS